MDLSGAGLDGAGAFDHGQGHRGQSRLYGPCPRMGWPGRAGANEQRSPSQTAAGASLASEASLSWAPRKGVS